MSDDTEQLRMDLSEATERLGRLAKAIQAKDDADVLVRQLAAQLREAKRKAKEAGWTVGGLLSHERGRNGARR